MVEGDEAQGNPQGNPNLNAPVNNNASFIRPPKPLVVHGANCATNWTNWSQQYEWFEIATGMDQKTQNIQVATFMSSIGVDAATIFNTFACTAQELASLDAIKLRFKNYFTPKTNVTYERYQFNRMTQQDGETFDEFLTKAKAQSAKCEFGTLHDSLLRDKIIIGIRSESLREQLLADDDSTLDRVTNKCRATELATKQLSGLKGDGASVHAINKHYKKRSESGEYSKSTTFDCKNCGNNHAHRSCPAFGKTCKTCGNRNHFSKMCRSGGGARPKSSKKPTKKVHAVESDQSSSDNEFFINSISKDQKDHTATNLDDERNWFEQVQIGHIDVKIKLDSGAQCNVIAKELATKIGARMHESRTKRIITYGGDRINVAGEIVAETRVRGRAYDIKYIVVDQNVSPVLGKTSCEHTELILRVKEIGKNHQVFDGLGCLRNFEYDIEFVDNPSFEIHSARRIPYAYQQMVKDELDRMVKQNVIQEVTEATPAVSPMVVVKQRGKIRICIDPTDVNKNVLRRHYPLKTLEEIAARVSGSTVFTKLDCTKGFWQIKLSKRTQKYLTFATPWGRYSCVKLPFGLCSAPEVFQQVMTKLLTGIDKAEASMDDILIFAADKAELQKTTDQVLARIEKAGLTLNKDKCEFEKSKIKFLGHMLGPKGVEIDPEKVEAIGKLREPENRPELQRLLGMVTYLAKFIPNLSQITQPLRALLVKEAEWVWTPHQKKAFEDIKRVLSSTPVLRYYNVNDDVTLQADASSYALGAAILQESQPVAYASRSLTKAERNYPQIEKEALAIRFACKKYHAYIYGKRLTVETDHKPLESIFKKPITSAPPRLQRILLDIAPYAPKIIYKKGETMHIADILSRDCDNDEPSDDEEFEVLDFICVSEQAATRIKAATNRDKTLQQLQRIVREGWPENRESVPNDLKPYWNFRDQIVEYDGFLLKGQKLIIPDDEKKSTLKQLHAGHQGLQRTLSAARSHVFWLNMAKEINDYVDKCSVCEATQKSNAKEPLITKEIPKYPFQIVATDLFTFMSREFLLIVDSYSGFFDFRQLRHTTSNEVIENLKSWFATHGIPEKLESDNGPQYSSLEFRQFADEWGFTHSTSSPRYPQSNGLAERYVQTAKQLLRKCTRDKSDIKLALLTCRNTPRNEALGSPNQRLMSRTTRSRIPVTEEQLKPRIVNNVDQQLAALRELQKYYHDRNARPSKQLDVGDQVRLQQGNRDWTGATVTSKTNAPRSYILRTDAGQIFRRNSKHLHATQAKIERPSSIILRAHSPSPSQINTRRNASDSPRPRPTEEFQPAASSSHQPPPKNSVTNQHRPNRESAPISVYTRSGREVKRPEKMNL